MTTTTKVTRDGTVTVDGKAAGRVEKEMRQGIFGTALGVSASAGGTPYWIPYLADGTRLHGGYETRKRAVARIAKHVQPLTVEKVELETSWWPAERKYVSAWVTFQGHSFGVSRYADEPHWVVDCYFTPDSMCPAWSNGSGSRVTRAHVLKDEMHDAATAAAEAAGVWPMGGTDK